MIGYVESQSILLYHIIILFFGLNTIIIIRACRDQHRERDVELPDEMLFEILSWLPAKSVCISKCCSKSFLNFTNSSNFALKQSQNSLLKDDSYFFIQGYFTRDSRIRNTEIHPSLPSSDFKVGVPSKFLRYVNENSVRILASSNGLLLCKTLLLTEHLWELFICNPVTQSYSFIPSPITGGLKLYPPQILFSFQCNENDDEDYKLYALFEDYLQSTRSLVCKMYIPKEGVWKETETRFPLGKNYYIPFNHLLVFYNGAIHFLIYIYESSTSRVCKYVASYNVESGVSRMIELPNGSEMGYDGIFKWGEVGSKNESICLVNWKVEEEYGFTVWVLSDHESSSGGWSKILSSVSLKELGLELDGECSRVKGFTMMNGRSLVFATENQVYDYDLSGKRETTLEKVCDHKLELPPYSIARLLPYSDTLRSCGIGSTTLGV